MLANHRGRVDNVLQQHSKVVAVGAGKVGANGFAFAMQLVAVCATGGENRFSAGGVAGALGEGFLQGGDLLLFGLVGGPAIIPPIVLYLKVLFLHMKFIH